VDMPRLSAHVTRLTATFLAELTSLRHANGNPLAQSYGPCDMQARGGAIAFNLCDREGHAIPYSIVEIAATRENIAIRGGCFCNPGAAEVALALDPKRTAECLATLGGDFTVDRFAACLDSTVGAVRVSFGLANNDDDIHRAIALFAAFRD
jgi:selenocysteine lyase/cysteine desulfurase